MDRVIKKMRCKLNISQSELAAAVNTNQSTISRLEKNSLNINYKLIFKILCYLKSRSFDKPNLIKNFINNNALEFLFEILNYESIRKEIVKNPQVFVHKIIKNINLDN